MNLTTTANYCCTPSLFTVVAMTDDDV